MISQVVGRFSAVKEHLSPAAQDEKLSDDSVLRRGGIGVAVEGVCNVICLVKAVNRKRLRAVFHKIVPQLTCQRLCQRRDARCVEVKLCAVKPPVSDHSPVGRLAQHAHAAAERRFLLTQFVPVRCISAERFGADIRQRRCIVFLSRRGIASNQPQCERQNKKNRRDDLTGRCPAVTPGGAHPLAVFHCVLEREEVLSLLRIAERRKNKGAEQRRALYGHFGPDGDQTAYRKVRFAHKPLGNCDNGKQQYKRHKAIPQQLFAHRAVAVGIRAGLWRGDVRGLFAAPDIEDAVLRPADVLPAQAGALFAQQLVGVVIVRGGLKVIAAVARLAGHKIVVAEQKLTLRRALGEPLLDAARVVGAGCKADALRLGLSLFIRRSPSALRKLCCLAQVFVHLRSLLSSLYGKV